MAIQRYIKEMASQDFLQLTNLIFKQGSRITGIQLDVKQAKGKEGDYIHHSLFTLCKNGEKITFESFEKDVLLYGFSFHQIPNAVGDMEFVSIKDLEKYYLDVEFLIDSENKRRAAAFKKVSSGKFKPSYDPEKLVRKFLLSNKRTSKKFGKLKNDYYEISMYFLLRSKFAVDRDKKLKEERPKYARYSNLIDKLFSRVYRADENYIKNYLKYKNFIDLDLDDLAPRILDEKKHHNRSFKMLSNQGGMPFEEGIRYPLDIYRRYAELTTHFINAIRISIELLQGNSNPKSHKKFIENCEIIRKFEGYSELIECLDPRIRHSESHINTVIDSQQLKIIITETHKIRKETKREVLCEYDSDQLQEMLLIMERDLIPALVYSFYLNEQVLIDITLHSPEYLISLLGIGNKN